MRGIFPYPCLKWHNMCKNFLSSALADSAAIFSISSDACFLFFFAVATVNQMLLNTYQFQLQNNILSTQSRRTFSSGPETRKKKNHTTH